MLNNSDSVLAMATLIGAIIAGGFSLVGQILAACITTKASTLRNEPTSDDKPRILLFRQLKISSPMIIFRNTLSSAF